MLKSIALAGAILCALLTFPGAAAACVEAGSVMHPSCMGQSGNPFAGARSIEVTLHRVHRIAASVGEIVSHPAGCPRSAFCGCGAAVRLFGHSVRSLWLAANWFRFPRAMPAPGMAAVRRHHVMVLEADLGNGVWQVFDANSGHHLTRVHARSIAGYVIVNPRSG
jgi:hypothetical protein